MTTRVTIWRFFDGKAGHRNQVLGLTDALGELSAVDCHDIDVRDGLRGWHSLWPGRIDRLSSLPAPDLLIGAGHATHFALLAARRRFGGRTIVLMKPSLPLSWFDLCLVPRADDLRRVPANVILTEGPLNRVRPSPESRNGGLILIGGPSDHFQWDDATVLDQIAAVITSSPDVAWTLTTSRRTPAEFLDAWSQRSLPGNMVPVDQTDPTWLPDQLSRTARVWVTSDSMSMIYEALTSGATVGLLQLEPRRDSRVVRGIKSLVERGFVSSLYSQAQAAHDRPMPLAESTRCAEIVGTMILDQGHRDPAANSRAA